MNVINGSHYYNKEMITEFLIMISETLAPSSLSSLGGKQELQPPHPHPAVPSRETLVSGHP